MIYTKVTKDTIKGMISPLDLMFKKKIKGNKEVNLESSYTK